jgi:ubiquinone/menaquinone biosynthesis C-methylase UbiE
MLKDRVRQYWDNEPCGTNITEAGKYSKAYFEEIENYRYSLEPQIFAFAQFTRYHAKRILEVGVGAGTDFLQWIRAGAIAYGIDLTPEGIEHVKKRLNLYGLNAKELKVADAEDIPYPDDYFDLVYSWGVIHHSPNTTKALEEIIRVTRPGGNCKIMVYNRHSLWAFFLWTQKALLKGRPWKSLSWCLHHFQESPGTKGYTRKEITDILIKYPINQVKINTHLTYADKLELSQHKIIRRLGKGVYFLFGRPRFGWFLTVEFFKNE